MAVIDTSVNNEAGYRLTNAFDRDGDFFRLLKGAFDLLWAQVGYVQGYDRVRICR